MWLPALCIVAATCAVATFGYFDRYPDLVGGRRGTPLAAWAWTIFSVPLAARIFIASSIGAAVLRRGRLLLTIAEVHAAHLAALVVVSWATFSPGHSSPGDGLAHAVLIVLTTVLLVEVAVVLGADATWTPDRLPGRVFTGLSAALLGGWALGILVWSERMPTRVAAAAEAASGENPYCLEVAGRPAQGARDLTGIAMKAPNAGGWSYSFHALLVIGDPVERRYMNWSYRSGRFEPVRDSARNGLHLDKSVRCTPVPHLVRAWL